MLRGRPAPGHRAIDRLPVGRGNVHLAQRAAGCGQGGDLGRVELRQLLPDLARLVEEPGCGKALHRMREVPRGGRWIGGVAKGGRLAVEARGERIVAAVARLLRARLQNPPAPRPRDSPRARETLRLRRQGRTSPYWPMATPVSRRARRRRRLRFLPSQGARHPSRAARSSAREPGGCARFAARAVELPFARAAAWPFARAAERPFAAWRAAEPRRRATRPPPPGAPRAAPGSGTRRGWRGAARGATAPYCSPPAPAPRPQRRNLPPPRARPSAAASVPGASSDLRARRCARRRGPAGARCRSPRSPGRRFRRARATPGCAPPRGCDRSKPEGGSSTSRSGAVALRTWSREAFSFRHSSHPARWSASSDARAGASSS